MVLIAVTGWGQEEDRRRAFEAGFDHHLTKPIAPQTVETLLQTLSTELIHAKQMAVKQTPGGESLS